MKVFRLHPFRVKTRRIPRHSLSQLREVHIKRYEVNADYIPMRQGIIHITDPKKTSMDKIIQRVESFRPGPSWTNDYHLGRHAIVLLATPSLASYLEEGSSFIPRLLKAINRPLPPGGVPLKVDVVCGCVDGLPPSVAYMPEARARAPTEGFAVLYGDMTEIIPSYVSEKEDKVQQTKSEKPARITFQKHGMQVTLPLANTLFKNGRISTLLTSRWETKGDDYALIEPQVNINALSVNALGLRYKHPVELYIPAIPLTYARELENGYGNIIRSLKFQGDGQAVVHPASSELEVKVPRFLREALRKASAIKIWALIFPASVVNKSISETESTIRLSDKEYKELYPIEDYKDIGHWISQGATLCRVQSGGGGWGPKAGLLSLDPEKSYTNTAEAEPDMPEIILEGNKVLGLDNIAKVGSYIQFFTPRETRSASKFSHDPKESSTQPLRATTIIGTIPSSIDSSNHEKTEAEVLEALIEDDKMCLSERQSRTFHQKAVELLQIPFPSPGTSEINPAQAEPAATSDATITTEKEAVRFTTNGFSGFRIPKLEMYVRKGEFGFVSESGMFVRQTGNKTKARIETKIDVPYSYAWTAFGRGGSKPAKEGLKIRKVYYLGNK